MANLVSVMLCPHCHAVLEGKPSPCPVCGAEIADAQRQPPSETVSIRAPKPSPRQVEQIRAASAKGVPPSGAEIWQGFVTMMLAVALGVGAYFFGRWVIRGFRGPGVLFFGYGAVIASPVLVVTGIGIFLHAMFAERRGKTPAKAFEKIWISGYFSSFALWNAKKAMGRRVLRSLPRIAELPASQDIQDYCEKMQQFVNADLDALESRLPSEGKWKNGGAFPIANWTIRELSPSLDTKAIRVSDLGNGLSEVRGEVCFMRTRQYSVSDKKQYEMDRVQLKLDITGYCVQNGKYYYMTDVMPPLPEVLESAPAPATTLEPSAGGEPARA